MRTLTSPELDLTFLQDRLSRTRVLIVRHGQSTFNVQQKYQGRSDEPVLTDSGVTAVALAGHHLLSERIDAIISSPLRRARQTADIITAILRHSGHDQPPLNINDDLMEVDLPQWQGLTYEAVRQQFPESHRIWCEQPDELQMPRTDGSTFYPVRELFAQASRFWQAFLRCHAGQAVALVTHGGTGRALISTAVGVKAKRFHFIQQSNCGVSVLEFPVGATTAQIEALNLTAHLGERMPKLKLGRRGIRVVMVAGDSCWHPAHVSAMLSDLHVDFVLSTDDGPSQKMAHALIEVHPHAELGIFCGDALFDGRHDRTMPMAGAIASSRHSLSIGVIVGRHSDLDATLSKVLGMEDSDSAWKDSRNTVLHYPERSRTPTIQAFNVPFWGDSFYPVTTGAHP
jgi:probable phosphoglycerate mutase